MANYIALLQFTEQGSRNVKETTKRAVAMGEMVSKMGVKFVDVFWTLGKYDIVLILEAQDDETLAAFTLKLGILGNVKTQTLRAFRAKEMDTILNKIRYTMRWYQDLYDVGLTVWTDIGIVPACLLGKIVSKEIQ